MTSHSEHPQCPALGRFAKRGGGGMELGCQLAAGHDGQHEHRTTSHSNGLFRWSGDEGRRLSESRHENSQEKA